MNANRFLTAKDIAERFQVSVRVVYLWVDQGQLPSIRIGPRLIRFTEDGVEEFIRRGEPEAS